MNKCDMCGKASVTKKGDLCTKCLRWMKDAKGVTKGSSDTCLVALTTSAGGVMALAAAVARARGVM